MYFMSRTLGFWWVLKFMASGRHHPAGAAGPCRSGSDRLPRRKSRGSGLHCCDTAWRPWADGQTVAHTKPFRRLHVSVTHSPAQVTGSVGWVRSKSNRGCIKTRILCADQLNKFTISLVQTTATVPARGACVNQTLSGTQKPAVCWVMQRLA
jgi:hypothetical protein